jgi:diguanylate cyclase (GGDEF)-like protein
MKQFIYRFLSAGMNGSDSVTLRKMMTANAFLSITGIMCFLAIFLNIWLSYSIIVAILDAIAFVISVVTLIDLHRTHSIKRANIVGTGNLFFLLIAFVYVSRANEFSLIWTIFFPIFTIPMMGHKKGLVLVTIYYFILFFMAYHGIGSWDHGYWSQKAFIRFFLTSTVLTYLVYSYEAAFYHSDLELQRIHEKEVKYIEELHRLSVTDPLTRLYNRRRMNEVMDEYINNAKRYQDPFSLILFDIDNFKNINDHYGHNTGDRVLIKIAEITKDLLRKTDYIGRWGGEEFLILLPKSVKEDAAQIAEKLRGEIQNIIFPEEFNVTCSFGIAEYDNQLDLDDIVNNADKALYHAKNSGKNCVFSDI